MNILDKIDKLRIEKGWSFYELSEQSAVNQSTLANMYRRKSLPSISTLTDICKAFGITLSQFFAENNKDISDEQTRTLLCKFNLLDDKQKEFLLNIIDLMLKQ